MNDSLEPKCLLVSWTSHDYCRPSEKEGAARGAGLNAQQREDQVLADEGAMQQTVQQPSSSQIESADGDVKRIVNNGKIIQRISPQREPEKLVEPLWTG